MLYKQQGEMPLCPSHLHNYCHSWHISKNKDQECPKEKQLTRRHIKSTHANSKCEEFLNKWPDKHIKVLWLLRPRNYADTKKISKMEMYIRSKIIIDHEKQPAGMCTSQKDSKAISHEFKGNVMQRYMNLFCGWCSELKQGSLHCGQCIKSS